MLKTSVILLFLALYSTMGVPTRDFFSLGGLTTKQLGQVVQSDCDNYIWPPFVVHGVLYSGVCVLRSGGLSVFRYLNKPVKFTSQPFPLGFGVELIAPYWANITQGGSIVVGTTDEEELLEKANKCINDAFPCQANFSSTQLLVATWDKVAAIDGSPSQTNTFQAVLATDGDRTYAIFLYADNGIQWSESGGQHAQVGISIDDVKETHPDSGTADIIKVATGSNVNVPGKYIYRIDVGLSFNTKSSDYYFGYFENLRALPRPSVIITTQESELVPYTIEAPGVGYSVSGVVTRDSEAIVNLPTELIALSSGDQGIHLRVGSDKVSVIGQNILDTSLDTFLCLPTQTSDEYVYYAVSLARNGFSSQLLIVGTEDNTTVMITTTSGVPNVSSIDRLETVLVKDLDDLTGTKVVADKPVSVFSGHQCANIPVSVVYCDHIVEQIPPTSSWGKVFYTAPLVTRRSYTIKILAAQNSTNVDICCDDTKESHLVNEGESVSKALSLSEYCAISSDKPVIVNQFAHGTHEDSIDGDPMMTMVPATNQYDNIFRFSTLQGQPDFTHYVNVIVLADYFEPDMLGMAGCDGISSLADLKEWVPIMVNNITEAYAAQIQITEGVNEIVHRDQDGKITATVYGFSEFEAYGHPAGITGTD